MLRAGNSENVCMMISGHKTNAVFKRYAIVSEADVKEAMQRMEKRKHIPYNSQVPDIKEFLESKMPEENSEPLEALEFDPVLSSD